MPNQFQAELKAKCTVVYKIKVSLLQGKEYSLCESKLGA